MFKNLRKLFNTEKHKPDYTVYGRFICNNTEFEVREIKHYNNKRFNVFCITTNTYAQVYMNPEQLVKYILQVLNNNVLEINHE